MLGISNKIVWEKQVTNIRSLSKLGDLKFAKFAKKSIALVSDNPLYQFQAVLSAEKNNFQLLILNNDRYSLALAKSLSHKIDYFFDGNKILYVSPHRQNELQKTKVRYFILTSGTTGKAKIIEHSPKNLNTFKKVSLDSACWFCTYTPGTYAWFQTIMLIMHVPNQKIVFSKLNSAKRIFYCMKNHSVTSVPATPTFWRYLMMVIPEKELKQIPIKQITLGGERIDQTILDSLKSLFPNAQITHIFAATETGPAIIVSDGIAGFPLKYLKMPLLNNQVEIKIHNDTLWIKSPFTYSKNNKWVDSKDIVKITKDRVLFIGRKGMDTINVGGAKVDISQLHDFIISIDGIVWLLIKPIKAPIVMEMVGIQLVIDKTILSSQKEAEHIIFQACQKKFPDHYLPRFFQFLNSIPLGVNYKTQ